MLKIVSGVHHPRNSIFFYKATQSAKLRWVPLDGQAVPIRFEKRRLFRELERVENLGAKYKSPFLGEISALSKIRSIFKNFQNPQIFFLDTIFEFFYFFENPPKSTILQNPYSVRLK